MIALYLPLNIVRESEENVQQSTSDVCPFNVRRSKPVDASHSFWDKEDEIQNSEVYNQQGEMLGWTNTGW